LLAYWILVTLKLTELTELTNRKMNTKLQKKTNTKHNINCSKSKCIAFGPHHKMNLPSMHPGSQFLMRSKSFKYLSVNFLSGSRIICDVDNITPKFYCASNCTYAYSSSLPEILQLQLQQSFRLPILQCVNGALRFNQQQICVLKLYVYKKYLSLIVGNRRANS